MVREKQVGRYRLLSKVGVGGMAEIFKAEESLPGGKKRVVAVKRLLPRLSAEREFVGMFVNEARIASSMAHPNIVQVYDMLNIGSYYYIVMEYLEGVDLEDIIQQSGQGAMVLPLDQIAYIVHETAQGLYFAHRGGTHGKGGPVIHRDISPGNILCDTRGIVKITDFGIARAMQYASFTQPGVLKGKYEYMAPEYVEGKHFDGRADIFSLGVLLYELLTGESPFAAVLPSDIWNRIVNLDPPKPSALVSSVPKLMDTIVTQSLEKNPKRRFQNGKQMARLLAPLFDKDKVTAPVGARVTEILLKRKQPMITQSDIESFLPPSGDGIDPTEQMHLDDLLDLVEPVEVPYPVFEVEGLKKSRADGLASKDNRKSRIRKRRLFALSLFLMAVALSGVLMWLLWPRSRPGYLWVFSDLKAEVFIDRKRVGLAPLSSYPLSPGTYAVEVRRMGRTESKRFTRTVVSGDHTRIQVRWSKTLPLRKSRRRPWTRKKPRRKDGP